MKTESEQVIPAGCEQCERFKLLNEQERLKLLNEQKRLKLLDEQIKKLEEEKMKNEENIRKILQCVTAFSTFVDAIKAERKVQP